MSRTYLVSGGAGFIGSNFIHYMLNKYRNIKIINVDKLTYAGNLNNLSNVANLDNYIFSRTDICDKKAVSELFRIYDIDYVVNFAAESHVDRSIEEPEVFINTNVVGTFNLLNCAKINWERSDGEYKEGVKFLQISTDEVYGSLGPTGFFSETSPLDPSSPYSASKTSADLLVKAYHDTYQLPVNITRCSNNYGPYQFPEKLIPLMIYNALHHKQLPVYGDGLNVRDWLFVEDHCKAIDLVLAKGRPGEIYNVGGHNERTNIDIVNNILEYVNKNVDPEVDKKLIAYVADRKGHDRRYGIDASKICSELNWIPETEFETGMEQTIKWYLENTEWMEQIIKGEYQ